jgi:hypothetical protein
MKSWKLVHKDAKKATLRHSNGHEMTLAIKALHPGNQAELNKLPLYKGGEAKQSNPKLEESKKTIQQQLPGKATSGQMGPYGRELVHPHDPKMMAKGGELEIEPVKDPNALDIEPVHTSVSSNGKPLEVEPVKRQHYADGTDDVQSMPINTAAQAPMPAGMASPNTIAESDDAPLPTAPSPATQTSPPSDQMPSPQNAQLQEAQDVQGGVGQQLSGIKGEAEAQGALGKAEAPIYSQNAQTQTDIFKHIQDSTLQHNAEIQGVIDDIKANHIDPNRYMSSLNTGQRISTGIGLILGGMGSGITGGPNPALDFLNKQIDRDIEGQKAEMGKKENLVSLYSKMMGNDRDGAAMASQVMAHATADKILAEGAKSQDPMAKARAQQAAGQLIASRAPELMRMNMMQGVIKAQQQAGAPHAGTGAPSGLIAQDPSMLVPYMVPEAQQKQVFGEIQAAQDTKRMGGAIMSAFDNATKENTVLRTGAGQLRTPASVYALHQAMQPTFKDLEGTVRQAAMDNTFKNITPMPGDAQHTIDQKREALQNYLQSKASAPTAKGHNIDLSKFESTAPIQVSKPTSGAQNNGLPEMIRNKATGHQMRLVNGKYEQV